MLNLVSLWGFCVPQSWALPLRLGLPGASSCELAPLPTEVQRLDMMKTECVDNDQDDYDASTSAEGPRWRCWRRVRIQHLIHEVSELSILWQWHINHIIWSSCKPDLGRGSLSVSVFCISYASTVSGFLSFSLFAFSSVGPKLPAMTDLRTAAWLFVDWFPSAFVRQRQGGHQRGGDQQTWRAFWDSNIHPVSQCFLQKLAKIRPAVAPLGGVNPVNGDCHPKSFVWQKKGRKFKNLTKLHWANSGKTNVNSC